ncbi:hypothetical protein Y032_0369g79 [Ancylostoma ceylanicum]|uniref:Uncharacterized protein n=1 Tax=Ancylostoma ceylanicum TaxID=53326 RepID=A0A016RV83_9BILA|nr:hypothetical protein Y032_0369g79 [Ancylostoma ceylanicum]
MLGIIDLFIDYIDFIDSSLFSPGDWQKHAYWGCSARPTPNYTSVDTFTTGNLTIHPVSPRGFFGSGNKMERCQCSAMSHQPS